MNQRLFSILYLEYGVWGVSKQNPELNGAGIVGGTGMGIGLGLLFESLALGVAFAMGLGVALDAYRSQAGPT